MIRFSEQALKEINELRRKYGTFWSEDERRDLEERLRALRKYPDLRKIQISPKTTKRTFKRKSKKPKTLFFFKSPPRCHFCKTSRNILYRHKEYHLGGEVINICLKCHFKLHLKYRNQPKISEYI